MPEAESFDIILLVNHQEGETMPREFTTKLIHNAENHLVSWESIARECLNRMSEDEVKEMALDMEWAEECEFDDDMSDL